MEDARRALDALARTPVVFVDRLQNWGAHRVWGVFIRWPDGRVVQDTITIGLTLYHARKKARELVADNPGWIFRDTKA